jgi:hypothetical protein
LGSRTAEDAMMTPADKLKIELAKKVAYYVAEWDMDHYTVVGVVTDVLNDIVWRTEIVEVDEDEVDDEEEL